MLLFAMVSSTRAQVINLTFALCTSKSRETKEVTSLSAKEKISRAINHLDQLGCCCMQVKH